MNLNNIFMFFVCVYFSEVMSNTSINNFFPQLRGNLSKVTWAHAVNTQSHLKSVLANDKIMMIEADILIGTINNNNNKIPIMSHPPITTSDLSLEEFLKLVTDTNLNVNVAEGKGKGVKLDFKSIEAFNASIPYILNANQKKYPLWINADILPGPNNPLTLPVNSTQLLTSIKKHFSHVILSLGWTTTNSPGEYTNENIKAMIDVINSHKITNLITFPVRASLAARSNYQLKTLLNEFKNSTLTIWSALDDTVNVDNLRKVIFDIGVDKIFIDVPEGLEKKLLLHSGTAKSLSIV